MYMCICSSVQQAQWRIRYKGGKGRKGAEFTISERFVWAMQWHPNIMCFYILPLAIINF